MTDLQPLFHPRSVAVIGATDREGSVGRAVFENLASFAGEVHAINPTHTTVLGRPCHASLTALGKPVDLAVIVTPAATVPAVIAEAAALGVRGAVIISAGFKEAGAEGTALEEQILAVARPAGLRIVGPNCVGIMTPGTELNATFATTMARPGRVAFLSQSGALCTAILDWSLHENVGFSAFVSVGSMLDVGWGDLIRYFAKDDSTESIVIYMESVGDAQSFVCAAREVAERKPIVVIKVGRTAEAARAAASHTGSMTGSDAVLDAVLKRIGVMRVDTIEELFDVSEVLAKQPLPAGPALAIVTNAGGPGALATDAVVRHGGRVAELSAITLAALNASMPPHWSHSNPVDVLGDADAARFKMALVAVAADPAVDGLLAILTPQAMTRPTEVAQGVVDVAQHFNKPLLASWMGAAAVEGGLDLLNAASVPTFAYPDEAARAFVHMWQRRQRLDTLRETNAAATTGCTQTLPAAATDIFARVRADHRTLLTENEAKDVLKACGIPVVETRIASTQLEAVRAAEALGYPVVVKLQSATITHKSDVGGVRLNLNDAASVAGAWHSIEHQVTEQFGPEAFGGVSIQRMVRWKGTELILGASSDPQFGPVLLIGAGGVLVEALQDTALTLPPLNAALARRWVEETKIARVLHGVRGRPAADFARLDETLVSFSNFIMAAPDVAEVDINPLLVSQEGVIALDARILLHPEGHDVPSPSMCVCGW